VLRRLRGAVVAALVLLPQLATTGAPVSAETAPWPAAVFLDSTHRLFLGRPPTDVELSRWAPTIELGHRSALTRALATSDEWAGARIDQLYRDVFDRPADPAGRSHWVRHVAAGHTLESVAALLYGSDEYWRTSGGTAGGFVERIYLGVLGREPDADGRRHWVAVIEGGTPTASVAAGFYGSIESREDRVTGLFAAVLQRAPDDAGLAYWVDTVPRLGDVTLAAALAASDERWVQVTGTQPPPAPTRGAGTGHQPFATASPVTLHHPVAAGEVAGFHESGHDGSRQQEPRAIGLRMLTMSSRDRGTASRSAVDLVVPAGIEVRAPVTGTVRSAASYVLYCRYTDHEIVIEPDERPGWRVHVLHVDGLSVRAGDRVVAGVTPIAPRARVLPFTSQVDRYAGSPRWPHVHVEVLDPTVPDRPPGRTC